jgi:hypothetical protein
MTGADRVTRQQFIQIASPIVGELLATDLLDLFNQIALLHYEEAESSGFLVLGRPESHSLVTPVIQFTTPIDIGDIRAVRKMLQISEQRLRLLCAGRMVYGFATGVDQQGTLTIQFQKHGMWEVRQAGSVVLQVNELAFSTITQDCLMEVFERVFGPMPSIQSEHLWDLVEAAKRQVRGTNVLITTEAAAEADRLGSQCIRLIPVPLTPALMERLTSIDGTVIMDTRGICHGIGAILDGAVSPRGDRTRGGRYNSALMYIDSSVSPSVIIVVSQNGTVDLVSKPIASPVMK